MAFEPTDNQLVTTLNRADIVALSALFKPIEMEQGQTLFNVGDEIGHIYFPVSGMISLLVVMKDGRAVETATVGREGAVGLDGGVGLHISRVRGVTQLPFSGYVVSAREFRKAARESEGLRNLVLRSSQALLVQTQITAACNALHPIDMRVCRWILQTRDCAAENVFPLTQEFLAEMLAVRRTSVTAAAQKLQEAGIIRYSRGKFEIKNREALERRSCECYFSIRDHSNPIDQ